MKRASICLILLLIALTAWCDNIRGPFSGEIVLDAEGNFSSEVRLHLEDIAAVRLGTAPADFIKAIELEVKIPNAVKKFRDSFALFFYRNIRPDPVPEFYSYSGDRVGFELIPSRNHIYYRLPVKKQVSFPSSPDTIEVSGSVETDRMPLLISILPVMKGIPGYVSSSEFRVRGRALMEDIGYLDIKFNYPDESAAVPPALFIDGKAVNFEGVPIPVSTGLHFLTISSDIYQVADFNFGIETGKTTVLDLPLKKLVTRLYLERPEGTIIFVDGERFDAPSGTGMDIAEGEHTIVFKLGDYSFSKKVYIERGREYEISLFMDIIVLDKER